MSVEVIETTDGRASEAMSEKEGSVMDVVRPDGVFVTLRRTDRRPVGRARQHHAENDRSRDQRKKRQLTFGCRVHGFVFLLISFEQYERIGAPFRS
jgi:hypothetical protein